MSTDRTRVYVDGFNLYYGAFRDGTFGAYKWLNLVGFCQDIPPKGHRIDMVRYFTAQVKPRGTDPGAPARQATYIQALRTLPEISIHMDTFSTHPKIRPVTDQAAHCQPAVEVIITEEKGSDVNLATHTSCWMLSTTRSIQPSSSRTTLTCSNRSRSSKNDSTGESW